MISGRDSSYGRPSIEQLYAALTAGVLNWGGYLATMGDVNLGSPWDRGSFARVQAVLPSKPLAYCSGWDDPIACARLAAEWDVRLILDVEDGIRGDGPWVDHWLAASGAGLYGSRGTCNAHAAPCKIMAHYVGEDPGVTWEGDPPDVPHGWQWDGDVEDWGLGVDRVLLDDWFMNESAVVEEPALVREENAVSLAAKRPDGIVDYFTVLPRGQLYHSADHGGNDWSGSHMLPGTWAALLRANWSEDGNALWIYGIGWDGGVWHLYFDWQQGWLEPTGLA